ncbi:Speckle-type POZ protein-like protein B [Hordeum vulgare]|nr:Speckle-type POZ protein-like protein B [Hordeum vulgare]
MSFAGVSIIDYGKASGHAIDVSAASGYHLLVVNRYCRTKYYASVSTVRMIQSLPFKVGGHRWCIQYFPDGNAEECANSVSLFLALLDENVTEALKVQYDFSFVDDLEKQDSAYIRANEPHCFSSSHPAWGYDGFIKRDALQKSKHLNKDCFTIRCDLVIATTVDLSIKVPPSTIHQHINDLLLSKEGTDVTFHVGGETLVAHRCVLAARSTVFKAELFGTMKGGTVASVVQIQDMEAKVFRALLNFVYTDSLPGMEIDMGEEKKSGQEALWLQHLLAAADRYDLQRLKVLCEEKLCKHIDVKSVKTIFTLAERHNCCGLKELCLEFLKAPANLKEITAADVFDDIIRTCPFLLKELIGKFAS